MSGTEYVVHVIGLPPRAKAPVETEIIPDRHLPDERSALAYARRLVLRGYRVRITGGGKTLEHGEVLHRLNR